MFCNKCGTEFTGEERCPKCGHPAEKAAEVMAGQAPPAQQPVFYQQTAVKVRQPMSKARLIAYIIMWALCAAGIILGIVMIEGDPFDVYYYDGVYGESAAFGGDFYTSIHARADEIVDNTRMTCSNIEDLGEHIQRIAGAFMITLSSFKACSSVLAFIKERDNG